MLKKNHIFLISSVGVLAAVYGCSSSSNSGSGSDTKDAGPVETLDSSAGDGSVGTPDGSSVDAGGAASEDAGTCPAAVTSAGIPTYAAATPSAMCTAAQLAAFSAACDSTNGTQDTCNTWFNDATNANCGDCISPIDNQGNLLTGGATLVNPVTGDPLNNTPGCVAIEDKTNGTACATPLANYIECEDVACSQCPDTTTGTACQEATSTGSGTCATYYTSFSSACASDVADGGVASTNGECQSVTFVATLFCGGLDGGVAAVDGGDGG